MVCLVHYNKIKYNTVHNWLINIVWWYLLSWLEIEYSMVQYIVMSGNWIGGSSDRVNCDGRVKLGGNSNRGQSSGGKMAWYPKHYSKSQ